MVTITTSTGTTVGIAFVDDTYEGAPLFAVTIDGEQVARKASIDTLYNPIEAAGKTVVAVIPLRKQDRKVGLTAEQVADLLAEAETSRTDEQRARLAAAQERLDARRLRGERESLVRTYNSWMAEVTRDDLYESEHEHINLARQREAKAAEPKLEAARIALAAFDAAHPEVLAEIKAEEATRVERNRWM